MKASKIQLALIILIGVFQNSFSQQIMSYSGPYKKGTVVYQYYEDNHERKYQGSFKYTADYVTISGQYNKNMRVGQWIITKTTNPQYENLKEVITGKYINDTIDGLWTIERTDLNTKTILLSSQVNFKGGYLINSFKYYNSKFVLNDYGQTSVLSH